MIVTIASSWLLLSMVAATFCCVFSRRIRGAAVPPPLRPLVQRIREIDADLEVVAWRRDPAGHDELIVDHDGLALRLPLDGLRDASPSAVDQRLRDHLVRLASGGHDHRDGPIRRLFPRRADRDD